MTLSPTLDRVDKAFIQRSTSVRGAHPSAGPLPDPSPPPPRTALTRAGLGSPSDPGTGLLVETAAETLAAADVSRRLLAAAPDQWEALGGAIDGAILAGRRVIAVTGGGRGEGRTTICHGLIHALERRGTLVVGTPQPPLALDAAGAEAARAADVVIVDAGAWFGTGPIHRQRLARLALGCDAVILVRRADAAECPAWQRALEALGLPVIAEALTFTAP
ncbi:MAG: hypothetical protein DWH79_01125 [Planctomycetota bacterium]|nr:MAG: hypothetical protein DWH79_01125 [Planctomycetota bacterium]